MAYEGLRKYGIRVSAEETDRGTELQIKAQNLMRQRDADALIMVKVDGTQVAEFDLSEAVADEMDSEDLEPGDISETYTVNVQRKNFTGSVTVGPDWRDFVVKGGEVVDQSSGAQFRETEPAGSSTDVRELMERANQLQERIADVRETRSRIEERKRQLEEENAEIAKQNADLREEIQKEKNQREQAEEDVEAWQDAILKSIVNRIWRALTGKKGLFQ